jgi:hypothetical protein
LYELSIARVLIDRVIDLESLVGIQRNVLMKLLFELLVSGMSLDRGSNVTSIGGGEENI